MTHEWFPCPSRRCLILTGMTGVDTARSMSGDQELHVSVWVPPFNPPPSWCATVVWNSAQVVHEGSKRFPWSESWSRGDLRLFVSGTRSQRRRSSQSPSERTSPTLTGPHIRAPTPPRIDLVLALQNGLENEDPCSGVTQAALEGGEEADRRVPIVRSRTTWDRPRRWNEGSASTGKAERRHFRHVLSLQQRRAG